MGDRMKKCRTDLAVEEAPSDFVYDVDRTIHGMNLKKIYVDSTLSKKIGKKEGYYYNLDNIDYFNKDKEIIKILSIIINDVLASVNKLKSILVIGLGNSFITPDSLGPLVINKIEVNNYFEDNPNIRLSAISPGTMGQTGMESSDITLAIIKMLKPDLVIIIDALACVSLDRMCHSIQASTAGINPGSGVGNHRKELSKDTLGVDVLAIGVPTVCDLNSLIDIGDDYFITPNNIDEAMDILSYIISKAINKAIINK